MKHKRRSDLQAVRGMAITAVLLFHFFPLQFPNGYVGVDQFFVLSGYLIAMIWYSRELNCGAIQDFYYRRVKRIVPLYIFVILLILVAVHTVFPQSNVELNTESAMYAMTFTTNVAGISPDKTYAIMLKMATDLFTHTWSLAVEMQFYLVVPLIFYLSRNCGYRAVIPIGCCSFVYNISVGGDMAFNSVLARLWQFCIGIGSFVIVNAVQKESDVEQERLLESGLKNEEYEMRTNLRVALFPREFSGVLSYMALGTMLVQFCMPATIPDVLLRCNVTVLTGVLIVFGHDVPIWPMNLRLFIYLGDISYALYLLHWPIYAYAKMIYHEDVYVLCWAMAISIGLAIITTETYEKCYLRLEPSSIYLLLVVLYGCGIMCLIRPMLVPIYDDTTLIMADYGNLSKDEAMLLNRRWAAQDEWQLHNLSCHSRDRICEFEKTDAPTTAPSLLILGNSYAANGAEMVFDNCRHSARVSLHWVVGCEPLIAESPPVTYCPPKAVDKFLPIVQRVKPDILFIYVRHIQLFRLQTNNGSILDDTLYMEAQRRLRSYQAHVSKRIFILGVLPTALYGLINIVNRGINAGKPPRMVNFQITN